MTFDEWFDESAEWSDGSSVESLRELARECWESGYRQCLKDHDIDPPLPPAFSS